MRGLLFLLCHTLCDGSNVEVLQESQGLRTPPHLPEKCVRNEGAYTVLYNSTSEM